MESEQKLRAQKLGFSAFCFHQFVPGSSLRTLLGGLHLRSLQRVLKRNLGSNEIKLVFEIVEELGWRNLETHTRIIFLQKVRQCALAMVS